MFLFELQTGSRATILSLISMINSFLDMIIFILLALLANIGLQIIFLASAIIAFIGILFPIKLHHETKIITHKV